MKQTMQATLNGNEQLHANLFCSNGAAEPEIVLGMSTMKLAEFQKRDQTNVQLNLQFHALQGR